MSDLRSEAVQLLDVLADRLAAIQVGAAAAAVADDVGRCSGDDAVSSAAGEPCRSCGADPRQSSCTGCPFCAAMAVLRGERPELTARLVDSALSIVGGLRSLIGDPPANAAGGGQHDHTTAPSNGTTTDTPAAQRGGRSGPAGQRTAERIDIR
ncbi:MAG: hypothetical protein M3Z00_04920 [Actinomycetota bacterium]|nr:hypothetical protein [Actinomycetota bacterium]